MTSYSAHPYGVEPEGNAYFEANPPALRAPGLGAMRVLSDTQLLDFLTWLDGRSLSGLCVASSALRCFASFEDLWKGVALERSVASGAALRFAGGSWKATVIGQPRAAGVTTRLFSDVLYHPQRLVASGPLGCSIDAADRGGCARTAAADLSVERFVADFETKGVPLIIEGGCMVDAAKPLWDRDELLGDFIILLLQNMTKYFTLN